MAERKVDDGWGAIKIGAYVGIGVFVVIVWLLNQAFRAVGVEEETP